MNLEGNCLIIQSGGPTAVINNSMVGIMDELSLTSFNGQIIGAAGGIHGLLNNSFVQLDALSIKDRYWLRWSPGAALGTWRHKLSSNDFEKIISALKDHDIRWLFYIGGNGSMNAAKMINDAAQKKGFPLKVIGVPKSIDNDLAGTDHSPGFGSAAKFLATSVLDVKMDMASYPNNPKITIIETMGRNSGWLAGACSLADLQIEDTSQLLIYIPEVSFSIEDCYEKVKTAYEERKNTIIVIAEGAKDIEGMLKYGINPGYDSLGRIKHGGVAARLRELIERKTGIETRSIDASIWQRSNISMASKTDVKEAYEIGKKAVDFAMDGKSGYMIGIKRHDNLIDYNISYEAIPFEDFVGIEHLVPEDWYDSSKNTMTNKFKEYIHPLIQGEMIIPMENGLPIYRKII